MASTWPVSLYFADQKLFNVYSTYCFDHDKGLRLQVDKNTTLGDIVKDLTLNFPDAPVLPLIPRVEVRTQSWLLDPEEKKRLEARPMTTHMILPADTWITVGAANAGRRISEIGGTVVPFAMRVTYASEPKSSGDAQAKLDEKNAIASEVKRLTAFLESKRGDNWLKAKTQVLTNTNPRILSDGTSVVLRIVADDGTVLRSVVDPYPPSRRMLFTTDPSRATSFMYTNNNVLALLSADKEEKQKDVLASVIGSLIAGRTMTAKKAVRNDPYTLSELQQPNTVPFPFGLETIYKIASTAMWQEIDGFNATNARLKALESAVNDLDRMITSATNPNALLQKKGQAIASMAAKYKNPGASAR